MLYMIHRGNHPELSYHGGQGEILHLEADLHASVAWAENNDRRWAFTLSNAGSRYFEDYSHLSRLSEIDWDAVGARSWPSCIEKKQAEFLMESSFPWSLIERVGVLSSEVYRPVLRDLSGYQPCPRVEIKSDWYY